MKIVELLHKIIKFFFASCPNEKNIINIPEPNPRLNLFIFEKRILHVVHMYTRIWWVKFRTNSCSRYLMLHIWVKFKIVIFKNKFSHFNQILSSYWFFIKTMKLVFRTTRPSLYEVLGLSPTTSTVTNIAFSGFSFKSLKFNKNLLVS